MDTTTVLSFLESLNIIIAIPFAGVFLVVGVVLTLLLGFPQIFAAKRFMHLICYGLKRSSATSVNTIDAFHALFTAMASSIGVGTIVGPSLAIVVGGPGALFWLLVYAFFGSVTKLTEVVFALKFRAKTAQGNILGGPAQYLKKVSPLFAAWYGGMTIVLFACWSGIQANVLAEIVAQQGVANWITGAAIASFVLLVLLGGAQRVGNVASALVPCMFAFYVLFCVWILLSNFSAVVSSLKLVFSCAFGGAAPVGGFLGATVVGALRQGVYKGVFITESGMGTSSIAHAISDAKSPIDQGILAMYSVAADSFLCLLSGLLALVSGVWLQGVCSSTLIFTVFKEQLPAIGPFFFISSVLLFIVTTILGNAFNGGQNFAICTGYRAINWYYMAVAGVIFFSALVELPLIWALMDVLLPFVALPNLIGILLLAFRYPEALKYRTSSLQK